MRNNDLGSREKVRVSEEVSNVKTVLLNHHKRKEHGGSPVFDIRGISVGSLEVLENLGLTVDETGTIRKGQLPLHITRVFPEIPLPTQPNIVQQPMSNIYPSNPRPPVQSYQPDPISLDKKTECSGTGSKRTRRRRIDDKRREYRNKSGGGKRISRRDNGESNRRRH